MGKSASGVARPRPALSVRGRLAARRKEEARRRAKGYLLVTAVTPPRAGALGRARGNIPPPPRPRQVARLRPRSIGGPRRGWVDSGRVPCGLELAARMGPVASLGSACAGLEGDRGGTGLGGEVESAALWSTIYEATSREFGSRRSAPALPPKREESYPHNVCVAPRGTIPRGHLPPQRRKRERRLQRVRGRPLRMPLPRL